MTEIKTPAGPFAEVTSLGDLLLRSAAAHADNEALVFGAERLSYRQLAARSLHRAHCFNAMGIGPGDHVGLLMPSCVEFVEYLFGISLCGAVAVPINARYQIEELGYVVANADIKVLITTDIIGEHVDFSERLSRALPQLCGSDDPFDLRLDGFPRLRSIVLLGTTVRQGFVSQQAFEQLAGRGSAAAVEAARLGVRTRDWALMLYTSGTTANPKGCPITHEAIVRNSIALGRHRYRLRQQDRFWSPLPLFHIAAILPLVAAIDVGACFLSDSYFAAAEALRVLEEEGVTVAYPCFVTIISDLINHPDFCRRDFSRIRLMNSNLAVQPESFARRVLAAMPAAVHVGSFGMTEAAGTVCTHSLEAGREAQTKRLGTPLPGMRVKIVDPDSGAEVASGERGEILVSGYGLCEGYFKDEEKTRSSFQDGWFHTGDLGFVDDDGQILFVGRSKDMLKVGGENVAASEIETFLCKHPAVNLAQVVAVADERMGEVPAAFVELKPGEQLTASDIIAYCDGRIARYKTPRYVRFVADWPRSASKIQKYKLAAQIRAELQQNIQEAG